MSGARKHLAVQWHISSSSGGGSILRCYCGDWESNPKETARDQRDAHRAHRVEMGETVAPSRLSVSERLKAAEAALAEATAKLDRLTTRGQIAGEEIELANRRLCLLQREMNEQREVIDDQRRVNGEAISRAEQAEAAIDRVREQHDVHSCERDGHIHRSTPTPCVNDDFCSCGQRSPCQTLAALDSPDVTL